MTSSHTLFEALSSTVRRQILGYLAESTMTASQIAGRFDMSQPSVSKHLRLLESAGLIASERKGQFIHYRVVREGMVNNLYDFIANFCPVSQKLRKESREHARKRDHEQKPSTD